MYEIRDKAFEAVKEDLLNKSVTRDTAMMLAFNAGWDAMYKTYTTLANERDARETERYL